MNILGFERGQGACNQYRIVQPLYKLLQYDMANILTINPSNASSFEFVVQKIMESEIIIFQRPADDKWFDFIKIAQKHGKIIVVDYDDDPFNTSPLNPAYRYYGTKNIQCKLQDGSLKKVWIDGENGFSVDDNITRRNFFRAAFKRADMVSTTTQTLQRVFGKINKNTVLLPNLVDFKMYPVGFEFVKKEIRIGWQGGVSHYEDLYMIMPAVKQILQKFKNTKFVYFGDQRFNSLFKDIPEGQFEWNNWVKYEAYPYKLALMNLDINLCPIIDNDFNRAKSAIKYFESSVYKTPTIASNIPPYSETMTHQANGLLVDDHEWFNAIEELVLDKNKRDTLGQEAYDNVYENYNADKEVHLWHDAFSKLIKRDVSELLEAKK